MTRRPVTGCPGRRDEGSALVMVLCLIVVASLVLVPIMGYTTTTLRANRVVTDRTAAAEAVKAGLRAALAEPLTLWSVCGRGTEGEPAPLGYVDAALASGDDGVPSAVTTCEFVGGETVFGGDTYDVGVVETWTGSSPPAGYDGPYSGEWTTETEWTSQVSTTRDPDTIWLPDLPEGGVAPRAAPLLVDGCAVFYPGYYAADVVLDATNSPAYFASGVYSFGGTVTIGTGADVVAGLGATPGCTDDVAAAAAPGAPAPLDISGAGATFVFGGQARLVIDGAAGDVSFVMNPRYPDDPAGAAAAGAGVSIMTVNGDWLGEGDYHAPRRLFVPGTPGSVVESSTVNPHPAEPYPPTLVSVAGARNQATGQPGVLVTWQAPRNPTGVPITGYSLTRPAGNEPVDHVACPTLDRVWVDGATADGVGTLSCWFPAATGTYGSSLRSEIKVRAYSDGDGAADECGWSADLCSAPATWPTDFTVIGSSSQNVRPPGPPPDAWLTSTDQLAGVGVPAPVTSLLGGLGVYLTPYADAIEVHWDVSTVTNGAPIIGYTAEPLLTLTLDDLVVGIAADGLTDSMASNLTNTVRTLLRQQARAQCVAQTLPLLVPVVCDLLGPVVNGLLGGLIANLVDTITALPIVDDLISSLDDAIAALLDAMLLPVLGDLLGNVLPNTDGVIDLGGPLSCSTVEDMVSTAPTRSCAIDTSHVVALLDELLGLDLGSLTGALVDAVEPMLGVGNLLPPSVANLSAILDGIRNGILANLLQVPVIVTVTAHNALGESLPAAPILAGLNLWGESYPWPGPPPVVPYVPEAVVEIVAATPGTVIDIPGYLAVPQGVLRTEVTGGANVTVDGGVLTAYHDGDGLCAAGADECTVGLADAELQRTLRIVTALPDSPVVSTAIVQLNRNGAWAINGWEVQPAR
ncbi:MAG TPA: hypothetical protein VNQ73_20970 [Ilumatobacter sp.]|nr:hypothetical protein [Ilumatobacter sp.]